MVSFQIKQLTNPTERQIQEIVDFLSNVFYGDPVLKAFLGENWSLLPELQTAILRATVLEGVAYIVTIGNGLDEKIVSVGCFFGPAHGTLFGSEKQRALGYDALFAKLSDETKEWLDKTYSTETRKLHESHFTKEEIAKRWWCYDLATHPEHQGKGYATAIMETVFKKAKADGTLIGLTAVTEENVLKYISMGFKRRGKWGLVPAPTGDIRGQFMVKGSLS